MTTILKYAGWGTVVAVLGFTLNIYLEWQDVKKDIAYVREVGNQLENYLVEKRQLDKNWLELDKGDHEGMVKAQEKTSDEIINLRGAVKDVYQIVQHVVIKKIPDIEARQDDIIQKINDVQLECARPR